MGTSETRFICWTILCRIQAPLTTRMVSLSRTRTWKHWHNIYCCPFPLRNWLNIRFLARDEKYPRATDLLTCMWYTSHSSKSFAYQRFWLPCSFILAIARELLLQSTSPIFLLSSYFWVLGYKISVVSVGQISRLILHRTHEKICDMTRK